MVMHPENKGGFISHTCFLHSVILYSVSASNFLNSSSPFSDLAITSALPSATRTSALRCIFLLSVGSHPHRRLLYNNSGQYLQKETNEKGIASLSDLKPVNDSLYLWQGDITTLACDAIVNAANSGMTGCYIPCHNRTYDNKDTVRAMLLAQGYEIDKNDMLSVPEGAALKMVAPSKLLPTCPVCGKPAGHLCMHQLWRVRMSGGYPEPLNLSER